MVSVKITNYLHIGDLNIFLELWELGERGELWELGEPGEYEPRETETRKCWYLQVRDTNTFMMTCIAVYVTCHWDA